VIDQQIVVDVGVFVDEYVPQSRKRAELGGGLGLDQIQIVETIDHLGIIVDPNVVVAGEDVCADVEHDLDGDL